MEKLYSNRSVKCLFVEIMYEILCFYDANQGRNFKLNLKLKKERVPYICFDTSEFHFEFE